MGGNAMAPFGAERITSKQKKIVEGIISNVISQTQAATDVHFVRSYRTKETHGDIDVLVDRFINPQLFGADHYSTNGGVTSFLFPATPETPPVQVDLIVMTDDKEREFAKDYFAYNDIAGNAVGRLHHKLGLKFGHDGLWLPVKDGDQLLANISVTKNFWRALDFVGLDYYVFDDGFDTLEDCFRFVASSPYFNKDIFLLDNRNAIARQRDSKRASYSALLKWCETAELKNHYPWDLYDGRKELHLAKIFAEFPLVAAEYHHVWTEHLKKLAVKKRISGEIVMELTGLSGKNLGAFMKQLRTNRPALFEYESVGLDVSEIVLSELDFYSNPVV